MQQALHETGRYQAELVDSASQVLSHVQTGEFSVAIFDYSDIYDTLSLTRALFDAHSALHIIAFPPDDSYEKDTLSDLGVNNWLAIPFYLPNLMETLQGLALDTDSDTNNTPAKNPTTANENALQKPETAQLAAEWQEDATRFAQYLKRLSFESPAQAALVTRGNQLWAYAGQLPQPQSAAEELTRAVRHFGTDSEGDLTRFIRLETTSSDYMLYTTSLGGDFILALAFEPQVSFMEMRTHVWDLAQKLSIPPQSLLKPVEELVKPVDELLIQQHAEPIKPNSKVPVDDKFLAISMDWRSEHDKHEDRQSVLEDMLVSEEIPDSEIGEFEQDAFSTVVSDLAGNEDKQVLGVSEIITDEPAAIPQPSPEEDSIESLIATHLRNVKEPSDSTDFAEDEPNPLNYEDLEPETASMVNITYTCVLIPRLPNQHLVGELAETLSDWVNELSISYGWRLDHLSVRPNYLHWRAISPPDYPPASMVRDMKKRISERIFDKFLRLKTVNPSGKFWADGHLIVNGRDKLSQQLMQDFINATRSRQGTRS